MLFILITCWFIIHLLIIPIPHQLHSLCNHLILCRLKVLINGLKDCSFRLLLLALWFVLWMTADQWLPAAHSSHSYQFQCACSTASSSASWLPISSQCWLRISINQRMENKYGFDRSCFTVMSVTKSCTIGTVHWSLIFSLIFLLQNMNQVYIKSTQQNIN